MKYVISGWECPNPEHDREYEDKKKRGLCG